MCTPRAPSGSRWSTLGDMRRTLEGLREAVGEVIFLDELRRHGWTSINDIRSDFDKPERRKATSEKATEMYHHLITLDKEAA